MTAFLSNRLKKIQPSPTLAVSARAAQLQAEGRDIISLGAGEPDFDTPQHIKEGAIEAMARGMTRYTAVDGLPALKKAIQEKFERDNSLSYELNEICVCNGGKQVIFNAFMATIDEGDEVIIPAPYWVSYPDITLMFGGVPVFIETTEADEFKVTPQKLEKAITDRTKWIILNSPSNPTGEIYTNEELLALADVLRRHPHVRLLSDDIYEYLTYDDVDFTSILEVAPDLKDRVLIVNGVSKAYAMTGWRIGYAAGPAALIKAIAMLQSQSTSNACSVAQGAAISALTHSHAFVNDWRVIYKRRRDLCVAAINAIPGLSCRKPGGAFYLYINCQGLIGKTTPDGVLLQDDKQVAEYLLESADVSVVSGAAFGLSPYFRISYATSDDLLEEACRRIAKAVDKL